MYASTFEDKDEEITHFLGVHTIIKMNEKSYYSVSRIECKTMVTGSLLMLSYNRLLKHFE